jgi:hypothetical protein
MFLNAQTVTSLKNLLRAFDEVLTEKAAIEAMLDNAIADWRKSLAAHMSNPANRQCLDESMREIRQSVRAAMAALDGECLDDESLSPSPQVQ